jgi:pimeloyl-ACP methyl ester carboxylesterase
MFERSYFFIIRPLQTALGVAPRVSKKRSHVWPYFRSGLLFAAVLLASKLSAGEIIKRLTGAIPLRPKATPAEAAPESTPDAAETEPNRLRPKVRYTDGRLKSSRTVRTLGGVQLWGDELWYLNWRIQRHVATGHCRLLDPENHREDWGTFEQCAARLEQIKREKNLPPLHGRVVVLLHGLGGWHSTMQPLASYLEANSTFQAVNLTYPSTRCDVVAHARQLASVIDHLQGVEEIDFVAHSLGNVVLRRYLADQTDPAKGRTPDPRIKRIVMLGPPNHGSERAGQWSDNELFVAVLGASALQLGTGWSELEKHLAVPQCEFGIIAGGRGDDRGYSSRLEGDDDNMLSVSTTKLAGARDFAVVPVWHSFLMSSPTVQRYTLQFLEHGYFTTESNRTPIAAQETPERR